MIWCLGLPGSNLGTSFFDGEVPRFDLGTSPQFDLGTSLDHKPITRISEVCFSAYKLIVVSRYIQGFGILVIPFYHLVFIKMSDIYLDENDIFIPPPPSPHIYICAN